MTIVANKARPLPLSLYPNIAAPAATTVQGKPGSFAHGFSLIQSQLVNATIVSTPPNKISQIGGASCRERV